MVTGLILKAAPPQGGNLLYYESDDYGPDHSAYDYP